MPVSLLHPGLFAIGIACVSIPIILHLLKRKRRPVSWGAMRFLEQAYRKRRRILTIEQLVLLALRCVLLALIALGVGSLMLGSGMQRSIPTTMVIVVDDSIGSALVVDGLSELERNKAFAMRAIDELDAGNGDQAMLISAGAQARGVVVPSSNDLGAVRLMINRMTSTDSAFDLRGAMTIASELGVDPDRATRTVLVVASAWRGAEQTGVVSNEQSLSIRFDRVIASAPATRAVEQVGIEHAAATRSLVTRQGVSLPMGVRVELIRSGSGDGQAESTTNVRVLDQQDQEIGQRRVTWSAGQQSVSVVVGIDTRTIEPIGARTAVLRVVIDDDANARDNGSLVAIATRSTIRVGVIDRASSGVARDNGDASTIASSRWVRAALAPDERFGISIIDIDAQRATTALSTNTNLDAVVVLSPSALDRSAWAQLAQMSESGTLIVITPDRLSESIAWVEEAADLVTWMGLGVQSPTVHEPAVGIGAKDVSGAGWILNAMGSEFDALSQSVSVSKSMRIVGNDQAQRVVELDDGSALAIASNPRDGRGMVVVFGVAFDLDWTNLPARPMFVPMMQEIVRQGIGRGAWNQHIVAGDESLTPAWVVSSHRVLMQASGEAISRQPSSTSADSIAGIEAQVDSQGTTRSFVVINPDAQAAMSTLGVQDDVEHALSELIDGDDIAWFERGDLGAQTMDNELRSQENDVAQVNMLDASAPGVSMSLWMLLFAGVVACVEFVLARLFTTRQSESQMSGVRI